MFIFYDTETTGTNVAYDQILQFAAILSNDHLHEIERFEIRCQLLPWVAPSPSALLLTGTDVDRLTDPNLPLFHEMMASIHQRFSKWGPATFIGYNSMRFDEPLLQRAFWQALLPPYATVTTGNARLDLLPIVRAVSHFLPGTLKLPLREDGGIGFKLDKLAALNGFDTHTAHDALGDVEATIFITRLLSERAPDLWQPLAARASKTSMVSLLSFGRPVLVFQHIGGQPVAWFGQRIDRGNGRMSQATVAVLGYDWRSSKDGFSDIETPNVANMQKALRHIALNKAPVIFEVEEANSFLGLALAPDELQQSRFLASDEEYCARIVNTLGMTPKYPAGSGELEETIFDGFPSQTDQDLMKAFQQANLRGRVEIARAFNDKRFYLLAMRIVYLSASDLMSNKERERVRNGIARRLTTDVDDPHQWRSICDAMNELAQIPPEHCPDEARKKIEPWLMQRSTSALL